MNKQSPRDVADLLSKPSTTREERGRVTRLVRLRELVVITYVLLLFPLGKNIINNHQ